MRHCLTPTSSPLAGTFSRMLPRFRLVRQLIQKQLVLINALVFTDFQWVTFHLDEKLASRQLDVEHGYCGSTIRVAGYTDKWITSGLPVNLHQRTQPRESTSEPTKTKCLRSHILRMGTSDHVQPHHCHFGILALESLITGDPLVSPAR
jgi:hypothetical protein